MKEYLDISNKILASKRYAIIDIGGAVVPRLMDSPFLVGA